MFSTLCQKGHRCGIRFAVNTRVDCLDLQLVVAKTSGYSPLAVAGVVTTPGVKRKQCGRAGMQGHQGE